MRGIRTPNITPEVREFILSGTHTGKLATVRPDGRPHVVPVWILLDGNDIVFTAWHSSVKVLNMKRDPRVCISVDEETPLYTYAQIEGTATVLDDREAVRYWATRIGGRYMGEDRAEEYGKRNGIPGEMLVRVTPTKVVYEKDVAGCD
jgi:PPOX class probable F420-dependent enzyme